jgi:hypothetical protein
MRSSGHYQIKVKDTSTMEYIRYHNLITYSTIISSGNSQRIAPCCYDGDTRELVLLHTPS